MNADFSEDRIRDLIDELAPHNNLYRQAARERRPVHEALSHLWDMGEVLRAAGVESITAVASAIQERSYITYDLVSLAFRVRRYFPDRRTIRRRFGKVTSYGAFREAFPLLENERYRLPRARERELVRLLNSGRRGSELRPLIKAMKRDASPRRPRGVESRAEAEEFVALFHALLEEVEALLREGSRAEILRYARGLGPEALLHLNRQFLSLADESFAPPRQAPPLDDLDPRWRALIDGLSDISSQGKPARNRIRRAINPMLFVAMGNHMDTLRDEEKVDDLLAKRAARTRHHRTNFGGQPPIFK